MNAVEIEEAISALADQPFNPDAFPYAFLEAFGNKATTIKRLKSGSTNSSDIDDGVLQRNNIHIAVCENGEVAKTLAALKASPATAKAKAKFALATDGDDLEAEDLISGETVACPYKDFPNHFGFFLPLAGISTVKQIRNNPIDIQATGRLNRLYVELLKTNEDWASDARRHDMNQFMARLIFCFFAEDTDIFNGRNLFTSTIEQMSDSRSGNTDHVIGELFRAMDTKIEDREVAKLSRWADTFPYVNGGLFAGSKDIPKFSRIARSYLIHAGNLNWQEINPDIFGSMIQAVADDEERGELGMHYTSIPNILKVLNPLFLDNLRDQLEQAGDSSRKLLNLRKRLANIRVFDPACGSGNFLVIAYIQMREIEAEILRRRGESNEKTWIRLENFYGIEIKDFAVEVARLSLLIAEFQCDVRFIGQKEAKALVLPLKTTGQIHQGNALRMDWLGVCQPTSKTTLEEYDLAGPTGRLALDISENTPELEPEIYLCGNPQFKGARKQSKEQKHDLDLVFGGGNDYKDCDYVTGWYLKASSYSLVANSDFAFVSTNSISRGEQVQHLWSRLYADGQHIVFCHTQFKWSNNAMYNAGVWCVIIGVTRRTNRNKTIFEDDLARSVSSISPYLIHGDEIFIEKKKTVISGQLPKLVSGNMARDNGGLILTTADKEILITEYPAADYFIRPLIGTKEIKQGTSRWCLWIEDEALEKAKSIPPIRDRINHVEICRSKSKAKTTRGYAKIPYKFAQRCHEDRQSIVMPKNTMEGIPFLTPDLVGPRTITTDLAFVVFTDDLWVFSILASTIHRVWAEAISGGLGSGIRYSSEITYNAFPTPTLTEQNKADLTRCAEEILLAREAHFPATIADLYDPDKMPENLRQTHKRNDEVFERIYIGRRFKNDTERLEKLFDLYSIMVTQDKAKTSTVKKRKKVS